MALNSTLAKLRAKAQNATIPEDGPITTPELFSDNAGEDMVDVPPVHLEVVQKQNKKDAKELFGKKSTPVAKKSTPVAKKSTPVEKKTASASKKDHPNVKAPRKKKALTEQEIIARYPHVIKGTIKRDEGTSKMSVEATLSCGHKQRLYTSDLFQVKVCHACKKDYKNKRDTTRDTRSIERKTSKKSK